MIDEADSDHNKGCRCDCGYTCGGPGTCKDDDCVENHFKRDCDHKFNSDLKDMGDGAFSVVCTKCGMSALKFMEGNIVNIVELMNGTNKSIKE